MPFPQPVSNTRGFLPVRNYHRPLPGPPSPRVRATEARAERFSDGAEAGGRRRAASHGGNGMPPQMRATQGVVASAEAGFDVIGRWSVYARKDREQNQPHYRLPAVSEDDGHSYIRDVAARTRAMHDPQRSVSSS